MAVVNGSVNFNKKLLFIKLLVRNCFLINNDEKTYACQMHQKKLQALFDCLDLPRSQYRLHNCALDLNYWLYCHPNLNLLNSQFLQNKKKN